MDKEETHTIIRQHLAEFAQADDADNLAQAIASTTSVLQAIKIDDRQKQGVDLMIGKLQQDMIDAAIKKMQGKFDAGEKAQLQMSAGFIIPGILSMGIFE